jgi:two-component system response regulator PilR (NtrC family)
VSSPVSSAPARASVLIVDDEPDLRTLYELSLLREGHLVESVGSLAEAQALLERKSYDAVITDMRLPDGLGLELLHALARQKRAERCVVMTAYGSAENAVEALKAGAFDYLTKPVDLRQFRTVVASAIQDQRGHSGGRAPRPDGAVGAASRAAGPSPAQAALQRLVGESEVMRGVKERITKSARSMAPILVRGESGTGKELVAGAIHACSHRNLGPFVAVNCGAIPESLLEAEFFGARKGSYTGATQDRIGYFQAARGGTLFLDEIGDLPLPMQSKLLRAIQERSVRPLGSTQEDAVDVRVVSATHRDLAADVFAGRFRQDLYYRLNVIEIVVPPLRERREDLPALCEALLSRIALESNLPAPRLSEQLVGQLAAHNLAGNVRELENLLHRAMALSDGETLQVDLAPTHGVAPGVPVHAAVAPPDDAFAPTQPATLTTRHGVAAQNVADAPAGARGLDELPSDLQAHLGALEREILVRALAETGFNRKAAAARLGITQRQMRLRIERLNISAPQDGRSDSSEEPARGR